MRLLPVVRGWDLFPASSVRTVDRKVEPIESMSDKQDYEEEKEAERMYQSIGSTYNKKGRLKRESVRTKYRVSCKA